jgi:hypothetical protein
MASLPLPPLLFVCARFLSLTHTFSLSRILSLSLTLTHFLSLSLSLLPKDLLGRWLKVNAVHHAKKPTDCRTVFVGGLPFDVDEPTIRCVGGWVGGW